MTDSNSLATRLAQYNTRFVRLLWCDNGNVIRGKAFHRQFLDEHRDWGIGISMAQQAVPVMLDGVAADSGLGPVGEAWLVPDWETLTPLPYAPGHARVMADMQLGEQPWSLCPRCFLKRMLARLEQEAGLRVMAAFEPEFYLLRLDESGSIYPADRTPFAATLGMDLNQAVIDDITDALIAQGILVERYYPESGPGQHEIAVRYGDALRAADSQIALRETVRGVALRHGLRASFLPKIFADQAGSGCHLHLSLWREGINVLPDPGRAGTLSAIALHFIGGILHHLPALMALTTPSTNSYRRLQPQSWSGAFRAWGMDNREAAVRVPSNPQPPSPTHFELKTVDASANPYLALGAVIAAGLDGLQQRREPGDPIAVDPATLTDAERQARQIDRLPATLGAAIAHLSQSAVLLNALGADLAQAFLAVRRAEWSALGNLELEEEVRLLLERY
ncbi:glutamine synthetase family protein [Thermoleptolyngbya sichuanensis XZ-Cy5]|uniref:glutamine synthetase family protein n=1 Tax=Thermoleptolyngbya sichuanensis TaxID=2885951 RepID=UPI00240E7AF5|nr:glutamine synthetase family protein [Thermoleptolyngbya sichuanensis]MDG2618113.1 glutamine synthetase family protein [Thermoleptolyngbya sichuanensis XZ-Cy5]